MRHAWRHARTLVSGLGTRGLLTSTAMMTTAVAAALCLAGPARADEGDYHRRALQAFNEGKYELALTLFSSGYAETKQPEYLIRMGQTYLKLGRAREAQQACQTFLDKTESPDPMYRGYAEQCVADARRGASGSSGAGVPPSPPVRPAPPPSPAPSAPASPLVPPPSKPPAAAPLPPPPPPVPAAVSPPTTGSRPAPSSAAPPPPEATAPLDPITAALAAPPTTPVPPPAAPVAPSLPAAAPPLGTNAAYELCLKHQQEGWVDNARSCYVDFIPNALRAGGVSETELPLVLTQLQRYPDPGSAVPSALLTRYEERRNDGMWGAGLAMWLSAWVPALVFGPLYAERYQDYGEKADSTTRRAVHYTLMVPVFGPFISGIWLPIVSRSPTDAIINYSVPWIVADGITQVVGFSLLLSGYNKRRVAIKPILGGGPATQVTSLRVSPYATGELRGFVLSGRF